MKKIIVLMLLLLLCASLTACGHMDGAEAAALYPDILGNWGTDYFGEESRITLRPVKSQQRPDDFWFVMPFDGTL